jgi:hypothetical protein
VSNFWANKLGGGAARPAAPAPAAAPAPQQQTNTPWWASGQQPYPTPQQPEQTVPLHTEGRQPARAMVAKQDTRCPDCGGGEYFKPHGQPNAMAQCYTCGYNPRFTQTTAGLPSGDKSTPSTPAKQTASGGAGGRSNYQPGVIIRSDGTV